MEVGQRGFHGNHAQLHVDHTLSKYSSRANHLFTRIVRYGDDACAALVERMARIQHILLKRVHINSMVASQNMFGQKLI